VRKKKAPVMPQSREDALRGCIESLTARKALPTLRLPYESRSVDTAERTLSRYVAPIRCNGLEYQAIVFEATRGLRRTLIACIGSSIQVLREAISVEDAMSGLRHHVHAPVLVIDRCRIRPMWRASRFYLDAAMLKECKKCAEVGGASGSNH